MYRKFKPLNIPDGWEQYWSKYPNGYTIMEALIDWVSQVDDMVTNQNELTDTVKSFGERIDEFINQFGAELQKEVQDLLTEWQASGQLDVVISEALQWELDEYKEYVAVQFEQMANKRVDVKRFASGDGLTDDTQAIQDCFEYAEVNGSDIEFTTGTYMINDDGLLLDFDNVDVYFTGGAKLKKIPTLSQEYRMLKVHGNNINIYNPIIVGDYDTHLGNWGSTAQFGHCLYINAHYTNINVYNPICTKALGDGIYIGTPSTTLGDGNGHVTVHNPMCDSNHRQGISITGGEYIYIESPICTNTGIYGNYVGPSAGIDIEANRKINDTEMRIVINNPYCAYNRMGDTPSYRDVGIYVALHQLRDTGQKVFLDITNAKFIKNNMSIVIPNGVTGEVNIKDVYLEDTFTYPIVIRDKDSAECGLNIENVKIKRCNTGNYTTSNESTVFYVPYSTTGATATQPIQNIKIKNVSVETTNPLKHFIYVSDHPDRTTKDLYIDNVDMSKAEKLSTYTPVRFQNENHIGTRITNHELLGGLTSATQTLRGSDFSSYIVNNERTNNWEVRLQTLDGLLTLKDLYGEYVLINNVANVIKVTFWDNSLSDYAPREIYPVSTVPVTGITAGKGASIRFRISPQGEVIITQLVGNWTTL